MPVPVRVVVVSIASMLGALPALGAQGRSPIPARRWEISVTLGGSSGRAATQFESAIDYGCASCDLSTQHSGAAAGLVISYLVSGGWMLRGEWVSADLGGSVAYGSSLSLYTSVRSVGVSAMFSIGDVLRIGAGPALYAVDVTRGDGGNMAWIEAPAGPGAQTTRAGFVLYAGLASPSRKRVFAEISAQRNIVGSVDVGPSAGSTMVAVPRTRVSFNYTTIRMGLGLRF
jgi:hypothetical protein